jgi:hypothetical protein
VKEKNYSNIYDCLFENAYYFTGFSESRIRIDVPAFLSCHWLIFSSVQLYVSLPVFGTIFKITGGFGTTFF